MEYTSKEVYEYVSKKSNDPIVERKKCRLSWQDFPIYQSDLKFYDKVSPTFEVSEDFAKEFLKKNSDVKDSFEYKDWKLKAKLPTPTLCPEEREAQRYVFRNEKNLYKNKCKMSGKDIISSISPDKDYIVYDYPIRWSDSWTPLSIWKDSLKNWVFNIVSKLIHDVPIRNKYAQYNENSEYAALTSNAKNCYMCFWSEILENCFYSRFVHNSNTCFDCLYCDHSECCYNCVNINRCFAVVNSDNCVNCSESEYLFWCTNCHNCYNCSDLINKSYCINNKQYTKEEYERIIVNVKTEKINKTIPWCLQQNCENCIWNSLVNCHNCSFIWSWTDCEDIKYTSSELWWKDCYDTFCASEHSIYTVSGRYSKHCGCIFFCRELNNCWYCGNCFNCSNCFWCIWLKTKEYCVFNKEYSKEEYNKLVPEVIAQMIRDKQWWEFFDPQLSYYWYNETIAMEYHPLTKEEALKRWYKWNNYESPTPKVEKIVQGKDLPTQWCRTIKEKKPQILDKILNYAIICEVSKRPFRLTKQEIDFYIKYNLPLPTKHPDVRHQERLARKDPTTMHLIHCDNCGEEMLSVHLPWEWKKVLCEKCYYSQK